MISLIANARKVNVTNITLWCIVDSMLVNGSTAFVGSIREPRSFS